jgi:hypothetical protein
MQTDYTEFFVATASAAGALIGLLFVAVSIATGRLAEGQSSVGVRIRSSAALIAFTNVLVVSLVALIPRVDVGWAATVAGASGLMFALASGRLILTARHEPNALRTALFVTILFALFGWECVTGIVIIGDSDPGHVNGTSTLCGLLIASLSIGIARSWELAGHRDTGFTTSLRTLVLGDQKPEGEGAES